jgi:tetratricopeptide (TPR) repeat protein
MNTLGYCYSEIHQHNHAWELNLKGEEIARRQMKDYPLGRHLYAEIVAQANVNLMENLFDQGKVDAALDRMNDFKEESKSKDYDLFRHQWESRMNYLAAQICLSRNELAKANTITEEGIKTAQTLQSKKRQGSFLNVLGEIQVRRNKPDNAMAKLTDAIDHLKKVKNPRQLWQAHRTFASAYNKLGRRSEEQEHLGIAAKVIQNTANGLSDLDLREGFLNAEPIRQILTKAAS